LKKTMRPLKAIFAILLFILTVLPVSAENPAVYFFYGDGCPHCSKVKPFIEEMGNRYPLTSFYQYEVYHNPVNANRLTQMFEAYNIPLNRRGVPVAFLNGTYFLGDTPILQNLEKEIKAVLSIVNPTAEEASEETAPEIPEPAPEETPPSASRPFIPAAPSKPVVAYENEKNGTDPLTAQETARKMLAKTPEQAAKIMPEPAEPEAMSQDTAEPVSLWVITGMALVDSVNPCAIAVLVILLTALMLVQEKKRALLGGLAFTVSIYISYFLFGLGISYSLHFLHSLSYWIFKGVGGLAVFLGLLNIKDFFWYGGGGFVMEIPNTWRPRLKSMLRGVTSPFGAFLMGFAVTLFELPCTGGPYFVVLGLLSVYESLGRVIPILLYYNVFFVLPLLVITAAIYFGLSTIEKAGEWKDRNLKALHLVTGLIMAALGAWILFS
ncbi:hypothetical protein JXA05_00345, partial [Candidatus Peregrinibacteria bacterium]|nr:hypothetical protein [Candidatus Peregrinibacteria bacterium]